MIDKKYTYFRSVYSSKGALVPVSGTYSLIRFGYRPCQLSCSFLYTRVKDLAIELMLACFLKLPKKTTFYTFFTIFIPLTLFETQTNALPILIAVISMLSVVTLMHLALKVALNNFQHLYFDGSL